MIICNDRTCIFNHNCSCDLKSIGIDMSHNCSCYQPIFCMPAQEEIIDDLPVQEIVVEKDKEEKGKKGFKDVEIKGFTD